MATRDHKHVDFEIDVRFPRKRKCGGVGWISVERFAALVLFVLGKYSLVCEHSLVYVRQVQHES